MFGEICFREMGSMNTEKYEDLRVPTCVMSFS